jgi:HEAT repeat protein
MRETPSPNASPFIGRAARGLGALALLLVCAARALPAQAADNQQLARAIAALRNVNPDQLTEAQKETKLDELIQAFDFIGKAGPAGAAALKAELRRLDEAKQRDDRFRLAAASLLWNISKLGEAETIAAIWNTTALRSQYNYVFYAAFDAAVTRDERALPMLRAVLRDREGTVFFGAHAMRVQWPLTHEFIWGAFGAKAGPALARVLEAPRGEVETASAVLLLAGAQHLPSLPRIRELAASGQGEARRAAVRALGLFGHPQDYDFLVAGLRSPDPALAFSHAYALFEYEDLRAVPALVALLGAADESVQVEAVAALTHLLTPAALEALRRHSQSSKTARARAASDEFIERFLEDMKLSWDAYAALPPGGKEATVRQWREQLTVVRLGGGQGRPLTRDAFLRLAGDWQLKHRLVRADGGRVEAGEILSAATPADIDLLLDVRGALYRRLSDECLYEVRRVDAALRHLGRSRYRRHTFTTEKVEAK